MQCSEIKAFRQCLVRDGFSGITIFDTCNGYILSCISPDGIVIYNFFTIEEIKNILRDVWFD